MVEGMKKFGWSLLGIFILTAVTVWVEWPDGKLRVIGCEVGQGDATLITQGKVQVLIDGGPSERRLMECLGTYMPFWDRQIELVILTHPEMDHIGGLTGLVERYRVDTVLVPDVAVPTEVFLGFRRALVEQQARVVIAKAKTKVSVGELEFKVVWPTTGELEPGGFWLDEPVKFKADVNEYSVSVVMEAGNFDAFFGGDISSRVEGVLIESGTLPRSIDLYKASHHGSKTSNSQAILEWFKPSLVLISAGENNRFGHPNTEVMERILLMKPLMVRTDDGSEAVVVWDGEKLLIEME
jgi:competence protein ComEC